MGNEGDSSKIILIAARKQVQFSDVYLVPFSTVRGTVIK